MEIEERRAAAIKQEQAKQRIRSRQPEFLQNQHITQQEIDAEIRAEEQRITQATIWNALTEAVAQMPFEERTEVHPFSQFLRVLMQHLGINQSDLEKLLDIDASVLAVISSYTREQTLQSITERAGLDDEGMWLLRRLARGSRSIQSIEQIATEAEQACQGECFFGERVEAAKLPFAIIRKLYDYTGALKPQVYQDLSISENTQDVWLGKSPGTLVLRSLPRIKELINYLVRDESLASRLYKCVAPKHEKDIHQLLEEATASAAVEQNRTERCKIFGKMMEEIISIRDMTQGQFANSVKHTNSVKHSTVSKWVRGINFVNGDALANAVATACGYEDAEEKRGFVALATGLFRQFDPKLCERVTGGEADQESGFMELMRKAGIPSLRKLEKALGFKEDRTKKWPQDGIPDNLLEDTETHNMIKTILGIPDDHHAAFIEAFGASHVRARQEAHLPEHRVGELSEAHEGTIRTPQRKRE